MTLVEKRNLYELKGNTNEGVSYSFGNDKRQLDHEKYNYYVGVVDVYIPCDKYCSSNNLTVVPEFYVPQFMFTFWYSEATNKAHTFNHIPDQYKNFDEFKNVLKLNMKMFIEDEKEKSKPKFEDFKFELGKEPSVLSQKDVLIVAYDHKSPHIQEMFNNMTNNQEFKNSYVHEIKSSRVGRNVISLKGGSSATNNDINVIKNLLKKEVDKRVKLVDDAQLFDVDKFKLTWTESQTTIFSPVKLRITYPPESGYIEKIFGIPNETIIKPNKKTIFKSNSALDLNVKSNLFEGSIFRWRTEHSIRKPLIIRPNNIMYSPIKGNHSVLDEIKFKFDNTSEKISLSVLVDLIVCKKFLNSNGTDNHVYKILI